MYNYIVWSYRILIVVTKIVTRRTNYSHVIKYKTHFKIKSNQINRLTLDQLVYVLLAIDKAHTVPQRTLYCESALAGLN